MFAVKNRISGAHLPNEGHAVPHDDINISELKRGGADKKAITRLHARKMSIGYASVKNKQTKYGNISELLPTIEDNQALRHTRCVLIGRVISKYLPEMEVDGEASSFTCPQTHEGGQDQVASMEQGSV